MPTSETIQETTSSTGTMPPNSAVDPNGCTFDGSGSNPQTTPSHGTVEPDSEATDGPMEG